MTENGTAVPSDTKVGGEQPANVASQHEVAPVSVVAAGETPSVTAGETPSVSEGETPEANKKAQDEAAAAALSALCPLAAAQEKEAAEKVAADTAAAEKIAADAKAAAEAKAVAEAKAKADAEAKAAAEKAAAEKAADDAKAAAEAKTAAETAAAAAAAAPPPIAAAAPPTAAATATAAVTKVEINSSVSEAQAPQQKSPLDVKEEDPAAPLLLAQVEPLPVPEQTPPAIQPPKITLPSDLKGWNYFFFVFMVSFLLANAGFVNAVGLRATGSTTSHYTGMTTRLGIEIAIEDQLHATVDGVNIIIFCFGVGISTISLGPDKFCFSYAMAVLFLLQGIVLIIAATLPEDEWEKKGHSVVEAFRVKEPFVVVRFLLGFANGLQNGISCAWAGAVARTTHCTGILTDIVIIIFLLPYRYSSPDMARLAFFLPFYFCFFVGSLIGAAIFIDIGPPALFVPAFVAITCSILVSIFMAVKYAARKKAASEGRAFVDYQMPFDNTPLFPDKAKAASADDTDGEAPGLLRGASFRERSAYRMKELQKQLANFT